MPWKQGYTISDEVGLRDSEVRWPDGQRCCVTVVVDLSVARGPEGIRAEDLATWEAWLGENGIAVEEKRSWDLGGQSIYFRDPDRHLIEIATPGVWSIY